MFCPNCGTKNDDTSVFCCECGTKLEKLNLENSLVAEATKNPEFKNGSENIVEEILNDNSNINNGLNSEDAYTDTNSNSGMSGNNNIGQNEIASSAPVKIATPIPKIYFVIAAEVVAIIVLCVIGFSNAKASCDPKTIAGNYFAHIVNGDYDDAYDMLEMPDEVFLSKDLFIQSMKQKSFGNISQYQVSDSVNNALNWLTEGMDSLDLGELGNTYYVTFRTAGGGFDDYYEVNLTKNDSRKLLFFDDWKVASSSTWRKDVPIYVPAGANVLVDGIDISIYKGNTNDNGQDTYVIPYLFNGKHKINVTSEDMLPVEDKFDAGSGYDMYSFSYTPDAIKEMQSTAVENLKAIYGAATEGKSFEEVKDLFYSGNDEMNYLEEEYNELVNYFKDREIIKIKFDSFNTKSDSSSSAVYISFSGKIDYYNTDWWGKTVKAQSDFDDEVEIGFIKDNGKWSQTNFGYRSFYLY